MLVHCTSMSPSWSSPAPPAPNLARHSRADTIRNSMNGPTKVEIWETR